MTLIWSEARIINIPILFCAVLILFDLISLSFLTIEWKKKKKNCFAYSSLFLCIEIS